MQSKKKRKPGVYLNKYAHGGVHGDPVREAERAAFAQLLADQRSRLDQGEIRPTPERGVGDVAADLATMFANPLDALRAAQRYGTMLPTRGQIRAAESPMGAVMQAFNPIDDLAFLLTSATSDSKVEQALGPVLMLLPEGLRRSALEAQVKLRKARRIKDPTQRRIAEFDALDDIKNESQQIVNYRLGENLKYGSGLSKASEFDAALKESADEISRSGINLQDSPVELLGSADIMASDIMSERQRRLGYTGMDPLGMRRDANRIIGGSGTERIAGAPITTIDPRGMAMVTGSPSEQAVNLALLHQSHGGAQGTGLIPSSQMQRMGENISLSRVPVKGAKYNVIREGLPLRVRDTQIAPGDLITTLSQQGDPKMGMGGSDRLVSFSDRSLGHLMAAFGNTTGPPIPSMLVFNSPNFKSLPVKQQRYIRDQIDLLEKGDVSAAQFLDDAAGTYGVQKEVDEYLAAQGMPKDEMYLTQKSLQESVVDPYRPGFQIVNTQGLPVLRADMYRPSRGPGSQSFFGGESEVSISAKQPFQVLSTSGVEEGIPVIQIQPEMGPRFRYTDGGKVSNKIKVLKKEGRPHDQAVAIALSMRDRNEL